MGQVPLGVQAQTQTGAVYMIICCWARLRLLEFYRSPSQRICRTIPKGKTGASRRNRFSFSSISARFTNRCLLVATIAAIDLPIAAAIYLVAFRAKSGVRRNSVTASGGEAPDPGLGPSAYLPGMPATPTSCKAACLTSCHVCPTIQARCIF